MYRFVNCKKLYFFLFTSVHFYGFQNLVFSYFYSSQGVESVLLLSPEYFFTHVSSRMWMLLPPLTVGCLQKRIAFPGWNVSLWDQDVDVVHLRLCCPPPGSCVGRCGETFTRGQRCTCDFSCQEHNECCPDFQAACLTGTTPLGPSQCRLISSCW